MSAPILLLQLLQSGLNQLLGELTLQLEEIKQIRYKESLLKIHQLPADFATNFTSKFVGK